jgi:hypothetical protein
MKATLAAFQSASPGTCAAVTMERDWWVELVAPKVLELEQQWRDLAGSRLACRLQNLSPSKSDAAPSIPFTIQ